MAQPLLAEDKTPALGKFEHPDLTADGTPRAEVALVQLTTLWFNTGSLCNIECVGCFMESGPKNDRLSYLSLADVRQYLDEIARDNLPVEQIGFTGGEPFMNKDMIPILEETLARGFKVTVLTNAMKPLHHKRDQLLEIHKRHGDALLLRVSSDHHTKENHEEIRGTRTWEPMLEGLRWLSEHGFDIAVAGRMLWNESEEEARAGYKRMFAAEGINVDAVNPDRLILFPEMDESNTDIPEITEACWDVLGVDPKGIMCASERMIVKRKGAESPVVLPCTLLPYGDEFEMGRTLEEASGAVKLNHPHCSSFCVLGGASCSMDK